MELVYLWVEEYKNIHKQGFNFSPRFNCDYDYENEKLTITPTPEKAIKNFFDEEGKINVTAIVGENGSGKTAILSSLVYLLSNKNLKINIECNAVAIYYDENCKDENCKKYYKKTVGEVSKFITKESITPISEDKIYSIFYDYSIDYNFKTLFNGNMSSSYKANYKDTCILIRPDKTDAVINLDNIEFEANQNILQFIVRKDINFQHINNFFLPSKVKLTSTNPRIYGFEKHAGKESAIKIKVEKLNHNWLPDDNFSISNLNKEQLELFTKLYIIQNTFFKSDKLKETDFKKKIQNYSNTEQSIEELLNIISGSKFHELYHEKLAYEIPKIKQSFDFLDYIKGKSSYKIGSMIVIEKEKELLKNLAPWIDVDFFDEEGRKFSDLSYGQKFLIKFVYDVLYYVNNVKSYKALKYTNIVLLLDEVETGLHPQWQKEFLFLFMEVLKPYTYRFNFHIIASSHSPFIISDLPKENVIFLKKDKDGNCDNVTKATDINPFGANIHTLLSDGFFMQDGLMGEFAKGKINKIKRFYEIVKKLENKQKKRLRNLFLKKQTKFWQIQNIIGEPFLKTIIGNYLTEIEKILIEDKAEENEINRFIKKFGNDKIKSFLKNKND